MRLGIDAMGGDFAPEAAVKGCILAARKLPAGITLVLTGDQPVIEAILKREGYNGSNIEIVHAPEVITMSDHPAKAFQAKTNSSIVAGFGLLKAGKIDSFASAGNTGAMMVGTMYTVKPIEGIIRPAITGPMTQIGNSVPATLLDVGINADCKPEVLNQYGILGSVFAQCVYGIQNPRVALLNIGEEEEKGNILTKAAHELLKHNTKINFIGNLEGNHLFFNKADVVICDGFTGNVLLKQVETMYTISQKLNCPNDFFNAFNYENHGGTPVLGVNAPVLIGHGISSDLAICSMIMQSKIVVESKLTEKIKQAI